MKNLKSKGFTLVEMLAVIGIIALLSLVTINVLINQFTNVKEKLTENQIDLIYSAAKSYVSDNVNKYPKIVGREYCLDVETLIKNGYLPDNLVDVINEKKVNITYGIKVVVDSEINYKFYYNSLGNVCTNLVTEIVGTTPSGVLTNKDVKLSLIDKVEGDITYQWQYYSNNNWVDIDGATSDTYTEKKTKLNINYRLKMLKTYVDDTSEEIYTNEYKLYIDKEPPTCVTSGESASWVKNDITLTGTCSDKETSCKGNVSKLFNKDINTTTATPGTVSDKAGNTTICPNKTVKIDKTAPACTTSGGSTSWTNGSRTLTGTCSDKGGSGCSSNSTKAYSKQIDTTAANPGNISDKAGNTASCPNTTVKIDKTVPTCKTSGGSASWTNGSRTLTGTCSDEGGSGCSSNSTKKYLNQIDTTAANPGGVSDKAGNTASCPNTTVKIDKTAPTCKTSGGSTSWTNGSRTLTGTCSDKGGSGCSSNSTKPYSKQIDTTAANPGSVSDNAGNTASCPNTTVKIDKTVPTCTTSGGSTSWTNGSRTLTGSCSDKGGSGCSSNSTKAYSKQIDTTAANPGSVSDNAGNTAGCPNTTVKIDKTYPLSPRYSHTNILKHGTITEDGCKGKGGTASNVTCIVKVTSYKGYFTFDNFYDESYIKDTGGSGVAKNEYYWEHDGTGDLCNWWFEGNCGNWFAKDFSYISMSKRYTDNAGNIGWWLEIRYVLN